MLKVIGTAILTAIATSVFWIWFYNFVAGMPSNGTVSGAGEQVVVNPRGGPQVTVAEGVTVGPSGMAIPVQGVRARQLVDTFTQARAGGARRHDAIDIVAPESTPVIAAAEGMVEKLFFSRGGGGISVYIRSPDRRWIYYYAHLQGYAPGLAEGQQVRRGQVIGRVGTTGNAGTAGPHLHFAINRMQPGEKWYQGSAINPYPLLAGKQAKG